MKKIFKIVSMLLFIGAFHISAMGHGNPKLADVMEVMGENFKTIITGLRSGQIGPETVSAGQGIVAGITEAMELVPVTVENESDLERYLEILEAAKVKAQELEAALAAGDIALVGQLLGQLNELRQIGHDQFRPKEEGHS